MQSHGRCGLRERAPTHFRPHSDTEPVVGARLDVFEEPGNVRLLPHHIHGCYGQRTATAEDSGDAHEANSGAVPVPPHQITQHVVKVLGTCRLQDAQRLILLLGDQPPVEGSGAHWFVHRQRKPLVVNWLGLGGSFVPRCGNPCCAAPQRSQRRVLLARARREWSPAPAVLHHHLRRLRSTALRRTVRIIVVSQPNAHVLQRERLHQRAVHAG